MNSKITALIFGACLLTLLSVSGASAQAQRTFVSGLGNDNNPCTRVAPCRNFAQAISATKPGGEVIVLDSAGYGSFAISQSVSIIAPPGVYAGIAVFSGDGIDINGGADVVLRGLTITNQGGGNVLNGIVFNTSGELQIENCVIQDFSSSGAAIIFAGSGSLVVKDSMIRNNSGGINVQPASGTVVATIDHVFMERTLDGYGLQVSDGVKATVRNSVASNNIGGFIANSLATAAELNIENCVASNNSHGIASSSQSNGVATVRVSNSTVTDNMNGLQNFGGASVLLSRGNNTVEGNGTDLVGTIGSYGAK